MHALEEEGGRGGVSGEEGGGEVWKRTEVKGVGEWEGEEARGCVRESSGQGGGAESIREGKGRGRDGRAGRERKRQRWTERGREG